MPTPRNFLFWFLSSLVCFFAGTMGAGLAGAGEGQGLAASATVLGYGVLSGFLALVTAVVLSRFLGEAVIRRINRVLLLVSC
jgi:hypothetical protein